MLIIFFLLCGITLRALYHTHRHSQLALPAFWRHSVSVEMFTAAESCDRMPRTMSSPVGASLRAPWDERSPQSMTPTTATTSTATSVDTPVSGPSSLASPRHPRR